jgi:hypothetical protein
MNYIIYTLLNPNGPIVEVSKSGLRVQEIRLFASLIESGWRLKVNSKQKNALNSIKGYFPIEHKKYSGEHVRKVEIKINHAMPKTVFGHVERTLIFPEWMFERSVLNSPNRDILCSFQGFSTVTRVLDALNLLENSHHSENPILKVVVKFLARNVHVPFRNYFLNRLFKIFFYKYRYMFEWNTRGRKLENKIIDRKYWEILKKSRTVYCPAGDFIWTYRFYEAVMSGAVPVLNHNDKNVIESGYFVLNSLSYSRENNFDLNYHEARKRNFDIAFRNLTARYELSPENFMQ